MNEKEVKRYKKCVVACRDIFNPIDAPVELKINTGDGPFNVIFDKEIEIPERAYWNLKNAIPTEHTVVQRVGEEGEPKAVWKSRERPRFVFEKESDWYTKEEPEVKVEEPEVIQEPAPVIETQEAVV
jgi:hypothetical protein